MAINRKLGRPTDQRKALLRGLVTELINNGKIQTTDTRAKEVRSIAEKLITIALHECDNTVEVRKESQNDKGQTINITVKNDKASRLHARRQVMAVLYDVKLARNEDESNKDYKERSAEVNHPVVEKLFSEIAPKYAKRTIEKKQGGGYTRMLKLGPRRGDAAEMVILELI